MAGPSFRLRSDTASASSQNTHLAQAQRELQALSPEHFSELVNSFQEEGRPLEGRVRLQPSNEGPVIPGHQEMITRIGLPALSSLSAEEQQAVIREESRSERRILEDLNRYVDQAPEGAEERRARETVRERIGVFLRYPNSSNLNLSRLAISQLPASLSHLATLTTLNLSGTNLQTLEGLPALPALTELSLSGCTNLQSLQGMPELPALRTLFLFSCTNLQSLQGMPELPALTELSLSGCTNLQILEGLPELPALTRLDLNGCTNLQSVEGLPALPALTELSLSGCTNLQSLQGMPELPQLTGLILRVCTNLQSLEGLPELPRLIGLVLSNCTNLRNLVGMRELPQLTFLNLRGCTNLQNLEGMRELPQLTELILRGCTNLQNLEGVRELRALTTLDLSDCFRLQNLEGMRELPALTTLPAHLRPVGEPSENLPRGPTILELNRSDLSERPLEVLAKLAQQIESGQPFKVRFGTEPSIDQGGPRRELITLLVRDVFQPNQLPHRGSVEEANLLPIIPQNADADQTAQHLLSLSQLGQVLGYAPRLGATIGPLFDTHFFPAVVAAFRLQDPVQDGDVATIGMLADGINLETWFPIDFSGLQSMKQNFEFALTGALTERANETSSTLLRRLQAARCLAKQDWLGVYAYLFNPDLAQQLQRNALNEEGLMALSQVPGIPQPILEELFAAFHTAQQSLHDQKTKLERDIETLKADDQSKRGVKARLEMANQKLKQLQATVELSPEQKQTLNQALESLPEIQELARDLRERCPEDLRNIRQEYTNYLLTTSPAYQSQGRAVVAISRGMHQHLSTNPALQAPHTLESTLVGISDAADILARLNWDDRFQDDTKQWLQTWLQTATDLQRQQFCQAMTGSPALPPNQHLSIIKTSDPALLPIAHTCSRQLELPEYHTQDEFNRIMDIFVANAVGFGFA